VESEAIERAMRQHGGNIVKTSRALGIQRNTLKRKLRALGLYPSVENQ
jgi:transcriptional regulator of acetoin/glycerol metabolism